MAASPDTRSASQGLLGSVARLGASVLALAENKVALFANEWETERIWQTRIVLRVAVAIVALTLASLFAAAWLVLQLWDWNRSLAMLAPGAIYAAVSGYCWWSSYSLRAAKPPAFGASCEELRKDRAALAAFTGADHD